MFASGAFIPSIPQIALDLDSTGEVIRPVVLGIPPTIQLISIPISSLAVSLSICGAALGGMLFATYSGYCERAN